MRAIVHFDGDSFFASVEQALNWRLRGRPVVVGAERGAATAISIEGKRLGLSRGMSMKEIRRQCPEVILVNSDYTAYTIYARRMYNIARRFTPIVEEYSIDECFADITGLDEAYGKSYEEIAQAIQRELHGALGITFGVGLAPSKVLAKTASKYRKPGGFTVITQETAPEYLKNLSIGSIWGIGPASALGFEKLGITTALDFAKQDADWLRLHDIGKLGRQIWSELNGVSINGVHAHTREDIGSIQKTRTFAPPSRDRAFVYSQLAKNVEGACMRARRHGIRPREISFFLKTQEFLYGRREFALPVATNDPREILHMISPKFDELFRRGVLYRATGISLHHMVTEAAFVPDLFGKSEELGSASPIFLAMDSLNRRFGRDTLTLGASLGATRHLEPTKYKKSLARPPRIMMPSSLRRKTIDLPFLGKTT